MLNVDIRPSNIWLNSFLNNKTNQLSAYTMKGLIYMYIYDDISDISTEATEISKFSGQLKCSFLKSLPQLYNIL